MLAMNEIDWGYVMRILIIILLVPLVSLIGIEILEKHTSAAAIYAILSLLITPTLMSS